MKTPEEKKPAFKYTLAAIVFFFFLSGLRFFSLSWGREVFGGSEGDAGIYIYLAKTLPQTLFSLPWFDTKAFYPYGHTLAWSDSFIAPSFFIHLLETIGVSFEKAYNTYFFLCFFLNGVSCFILAQRLGASFLSSLFAGVAFEESMFLKLHLGHPQLQCAFFIPLLINLALKEKSFLTGVKITSLFTFAFLSSVYISFFSMIVLLMVLALEWRKVFSRQFLLGVIVPLFFLLPFLLPYSEVNEVFGGRKIFEGYPFAANILSYFSPPSLSTAYGERSGWDFLPHAHAEAQFFPGFLLLIVATKFIYSCFGMVPTFLICSTLALTLKDGFLLIGTLFPVLVAGFLLLRKYEQKKLIGFLLIFSLSLSLGSQKHTSSLHEILTVVFPPLLSLRAIGRFGIVAHLFFSLSGAFALSTLSPKSRSTLIQLLCIGAVYYEQSFFVLQKGELKESIVSFNESLKSEEATILLPFAGPIKDGHIASWNDFAMKNVEAMLLFRNSPFSLVNGFSGLQGRLTEKLAQRLNVFPDTSALQALREIIGVNYFIVRDSEIPKDIKNTKIASEGGYSLFHIGTVEVKNSFEFIAPHSAKKISVTLSSTNNCDVIFSSGESLKEAHTTPAPFVFELTLPKPLNLVQPKKIKVEHSCPSLFIGETKVIER